MSALLMISALLPLVLAPFAGARWRLSSVAHRLAPWSALPALATALWASPDLRLEIPWLLLGTTLGLDPVGRIFLFFTALLWFVSGLYAHAYVRPRERSRFFFFFLLTLSGNLGLVISHDLASFYLFFALMTFAAYGLVVHEGGEAAIRAGRVYIILALLGEGMLLAGGLLAASFATGLEVSEISSALADAPGRDAAIALLFLGFGVKAGIPPLHVWLPLAHPVAPTPASAVLSGSMIKAGLLGWLRFLPLGETDLPGWGAGVIVLGLATALLAALVGAVQKAPKTVLAYSSVSQMGIMTAALGVGLLHSELAPLVVSVIAVYALHHSLVKGALFLGVGVVTTRSGTAFGTKLPRTGLAFAALAMAGAPLTSGEIAKHYVKEVGHLAPGAWAHRLDVILPLTAVGTTLLMARVLQRSFSEEEGRHHLSPGLWSPWLALLLAVAGVLWMASGMYPPNLEPPELPDGAGLWAGTWPILVGSLLFAGALRLARRYPRVSERLRPPPGDLLIPVQSAMSWLQKSFGRIPIRHPPDPVAWIAENWYGVYASRERWAALQRVELRLMRWSTAGLLFVLFGLILLATLYLEEG